MYSSIIKKFLHSFYNRLILFQIRQPTTKKELIKCINRVMLTQNENFRCLVYALVNVQTTQTL